MILTIIAAGEGSRLKSEGINIPKPLVKVGKTTLVERLITNAIQNGIGKVCIIVNEESGEVVNFIKKRNFKIPIQIKIKSTPSSLHSMYELKDFVSEPFLMGTVDSIFKPDEYSNFINYCKENKSADVILGITDYIDDETPLCVELNGKNIISFHNENGNHKWATGGVYYFRPQVFPFAKKAIDSGIFRLRNFLNLLLKEKKQIEGFKFSKIIDIDHLSDIKKANDFVNSFSNINNYV